MLPLTISYQERTITSPHIKVPKQRQSENKASYVLNSAVFLENVKINPHAAKGYDVSLDIPRERPPYANAMGTFQSWHLVICVDVARALDVTMQRELNVTVN